MAVAPLNVQKSCKYGTLVFNPLDQYVGRALMNYGEYSEGEVDLFRQIVRAGDCVIEVGSNIGAHTIPLARFVGASGFIFAFEPQRILFQTLCCNLAINSITNTFAYHAAVGAQTGVLQTPALDYNHAANYGAISFADPKRWAGAEIPKESVPLKTLNSIDTRACKLLKVDVEGMEKAVLQGGQELIKRCRPFLYVENDRAEQASELVEFLLSLRYKLYWHTPKLFNPNNFASVEENLYPNTISVNIFAVPVELQDFTVSGLYPVTNPVHPLLAAN